MTSVVDRRRVLLTSLAGAIAVPLGAEGQQAGAVHRIGLLGPGGPGPGPEEFRRGLSELGHVEGWNIRFECRWAENTIDRPPELAAELVQARVDVIVAFISSTAKAAQRATTTIPIVMVSVGDPVGLGLVTSLGRPGGNITGTTSFGPELGAKRIQLLKELIPGLKRDPLHHLDLVGPRGGAGSEGGAPPRAGDAPADRPRGLVKLNAAGRRLRAALGFLHLSPRAPELRLLHRWLDSWSGVGLIAVGLHRVGHDLRLIQQGDERFL
jgi:hypothetical protein